MFLQSQINDAVVQNAGQTGDGAPHFQNVGALADLIQNPGDDAVGNRRRRARRHNESVFSSCHSS